MGPTLIRLPPRPCLENPFDDPTPVVFAVGGVSILLEGARSAIDACRLSIYSRPHQLKVGCRSHPMGSGRHGLSRLPDTFGMSRSLLVCFSPIPSWNLCFFWVLMAVHMFVASSILSCPLIGTGSLFTKPSAAARPEPVPWTAWLLWILSLGKSQPLRRAVCHVREA